MAIVYEGKIFKRDTKLKLQLIMRFSFVIMIWCLDIACLLCNNPYISAGTLIYAIISVTILFLIDKCIPNDFKYFVCVYYGDIIVVRITEREKNTFTISSLSVMCNKHELWIKDDKQIVKMNYNKEMLEFLNGVIENKCIERNKEHTS